MGGKILIVDDMELNRTILEEILIEEYEILQATGGEDALVQLQQHKDDISVVLLDLLMPDIDGFHVLEYMNETQLIHQIPVLVISTETSADIEDKCFDLGVSDFIRKPFSNSQIRHRVKNIASLFSYKNKLEKEVQRQTDTVRRQYKLLKEQTETLQNTNVRIMDILGTVVEYRNLETSNHIWHVREFSRILATQAAKDYPEFGLTQQKIEILAYASTLHDIGKIAIPDSILLKPGKLTPVERDYMKSHPLRGCEIIETIHDIWDETYSKTCYEICRSHHERYDGGGYPDGLKREEIPLSAQIVSIADAYDALVSERVYKGAYTKEQSFQMMISGECGIFSPKLLECFRKVRDQFEEILDK